MQIPLFQCPLLGISEKNPLLIAKVLLTVLIAGARAGLLRDGQNVGPQLA